MVNRWVALDDPVATWVADLHPVRHEPAKLWYWLEAVVRAGERYQVHTIQAIHRYGYTRGADGAALPFLRTLFDRDGILDLLNLESLFVPAATLAYYDAGGRLTEASVEDVGLLLRTLRPDADDTAGAVLEQGAPLTIMGPKINIRHPEQSIWAYKADAISVRFQILSDIWLPWVRGYLDDAPDGTGFYDNRELALQHTTRLNQFLRVARDVTAELGGTWELDPEGCIAGLRFMVAESGILLDAQPPD